MSKKRLAALVGEATVDCYNESEALVGFFTMIEDHLEVPFATVVLGVDVKVTGLELTEREEIVAVCVRGKHRQRIPVCDLKTRFQIASWRRQAECKSSLLPPMRKHWRFDFAKTRFCTPGSSHSLR